MRAAINDALEGKGAVGPYVVKFIVCMVILSVTSFALSTVPDYQEEYETIFTLIEGGTVLIFTVEYVLRLWTSSLGPMGYAFQFIAIVDLCSVLPTWIDAVLPGDNFPAFQFLRMFRLFKFLASSKRGGKAVQAFSDSWTENSGLILAASFAGGAVWLVTASLQYVAEKDNEDMLWCYPPVGYDAAAVKASEHMANQNHHSHHHTQNALPSCVCDDDECTGPGCECVPRFDSIPSAMFFVILNLSGEFPLADKHSLMGRFVASFTAIMSVGVFAIPTGLVGAALEGAISALNSGTEEDYDVDDDDVAEIVADFDTEDGKIPSPAFTLTPLYKQICGVMVVLSGSAAVLSTVSSVVTDNEQILNIFWLMDVACIAFFAFEWFSRVTVDRGVYVLDWFKLLISSPFNMQTVDLLSWLPDFLWIFILGASSSLALSTKGTEQLLEGQEPTLNVSTGFLMGGLPAFITLTVSIFRMLKFERYIHGFKILNKVIDKSQGVLMVGGFASLVIVVFSSTIMYYAERNNPDPNMSKYYDSVPKAMWVTLLNLSGEAPLCNYTTMGRLVVGALSITATAIFAIPVGALGAGFESVVSEIKTAHDEATDSDSGEVLPISNSNTGVEMGKYGAVPHKEVGAGGDSNLKMNQADADADADEKEKTKYSDMTSLQRLVAGDGTRGQLFMLVSMCATLFAVTLEILSTCEFAKDTDSAKEIVDMCEFVVVMWFTFEFCLRTAANGFQYTFSFLGFVDIISTFPYYFAKGLAGSSIAAIVNVYDGPLRAMRILRLVRLDEYAPSLTLVDDAFRNCWSGLSVAVFAGAVIWFLFNEILYFTERSDEDEGEDKRFRNALSSLQFSGVLLTGDYPIVDFSLTGKLTCAVMIIVAVGIVAVPASILAGAFVDLLQEQAEARRKQRFEAASNMQRAFKGTKQVTLSAKSPKGTAIALKQTPGTYREALTPGVTKNPAGYTRPAFYSKNKPWVPAGAPVPVLAKGVGYYTPVFTNPNIPTDKEMSSLLAVGVRADRAISKKNANKFQALVEDARTHSAELRGLDQPNWVARLCMWKNSTGPGSESSHSASMYKKFLGWLVFLNIVAVVLESMPSVEPNVPHFLWQGFEGVSVLFFSVEYVINVLTAAYDPKHNFSCITYMTSFIGMSDLFSIVPFYVQTLVLPALYGDAAEGMFDGTIFRIMRLARILEFEQFFEAFTLLDDVFTKAGPVLKATGVLALILWVGSASMFYYSSPHADTDDDAVNEGGEDAAVFTSIVDALYYTSIFMAGEWCNVDFTPFGGLVCICLAMVGVALFSIPVGVLFEGFQDMLTEKHGGGGDDGDGTTVNDNDEEEGDSK